MEKSKEHEDGNRRRAVDFAFRSPLVYFSLKSKAGHATVYIQIALEIAKKASSKISQGSTYMPNSNNSYDYSVNEQVWCLAPQVVVTKENKR